MNSYTDDIAKKDMTGSQQPQASYVHWKFFCLVVHWHSNASMKPSCHVELQGGERFGLSRRPTVSSYVVVRSLDLTKILKLMYWRQMSLNTCSVNTMQQNRSVQQFTRSYAKSLYLLQLNTILIWSCLIFSGSMCTQLGFMNRFLLIQIHPVCEKTKNLG